MLGPLRDPCAVRDEVQIAGLHTICDNISARVDAVMFAPGFPVAVKEDLLDEVFTFLLMVQQFFAGLAGPAVYGVGPLCVSPVYHLLGERLG